MAAHTVKVAVACPLSGERAAFTEWLNSAGYQAVPMVSLESVAREMAANPFEALIADAALVSAAELPRVVKMLGTNRPLILVGTADQKVEEVPRDATWMPRPVTRDVFLLSMGLALAEGRPARRSPRTVVSRLLSTVDGMSAKIVDVSSEGVRLEIPGATTSGLPPYFLLKVPAFGVIAKVKRVWVAQPGPSHSWCGGIIERPAERPAKMPWPVFVKTAPLGNRRLELVD
jgi:hypothetical protein